jgi:hypothetical protein
VGLGLLVAVEAAACEVVKVKRQIRELIDRLDVVYGCCEACAIT